MAFTAYDYDLARYSLAINAGANDRALRAARGCIEPGAIVRWVPERPITDEEWAEMDADLQAFIDAQTKPVPLAQRTSPWPWG